MYKVGTTVIFNENASTERKIDRVLRVETYDCLRKWLAINEELSHLIVISSIPICYNDFSKLEAALTITGGELLDDLLDHWRAKFHMEERLDFVKLLCDWAHTSKTRVTIVSGDVHLAALGAMHHKTYLKTSNAGEINCLITSAVVNAPPPPELLTYLRVRCSWMENLTPKINSRLCRFQPNNESWYLRTRNFLTMLEGPDRSLHCHWVTESTHDKDSNNALVINPWTEKAKPDQNIDY